MGPEPDTTRLLVLPMEQPLAHSWRQQQGTPSTPSVMLLRGRRYQGAGSSIPILAARNMTSYQLSNLSRKRGIHQQLTTCCCVLADLTGATIATMSPSRSRCDPRLSLSALGPPLRRAAHVRPPLLFIRTASLSHLALLSLPEALYLASYKGYARSGGRSGPRQGSKSRPSKMQLTYA